MTIAVKIWWNTDADGTPVAEDLPWEDMPCSYYGPFEDINAAVAWMENDYPDGDIDVAEMIADEYDIPEDADYLNAPDSIHGDNPDQDSPFRIVMIDLAPGPREIQGS